jgi:uncharacterized protein (TIGR02118 family)
MTPCFVADSSTSEWRWRIDAGLDRSELSGRKTMVKLTFCLRRLPHLSREEFQSYWLGTHAALVRSHAAALRIHGYVQLHTETTRLNDLLRAGRGGPEEYDGVAELWWSSLEELAEAMSTPEGTAAGAALLEDEKRFIDLERSPLWLGEEREIL